MERQEEIRITSKESHLDTRSFSGFHPKYFPGKYSTTNYNSNNNINRDDAASDIDAVYTINDFKTASYKPGNCFESVLTAVVVLVHK